MPGTIHVSVLGFEALHSSPTSSPVSVKISIGKREFETMGTGDFAFPLTTLRDKLVVTLEDGEGNVISCADIETKEVVAKGVWDENFCLDGGGYVHMKLQFVLSEEERHKIRVIRESALKKKHDELCNGSPRTPGFEVQGVVLPQGDSDEKGNLSARTSTTPRVIDDRLPEPHQRNFIEMPTSGGSMLANAAISSSNMLRADSMNQNEVNDIRKVGPADRSHSSVKKMINAFESNQIQDAKPTEKPPPIKYQTRKIEAESPLETSLRTHLGIGERILAAKPTLRNIPGEFQQIDANVTQDCEKTSSLISFNEAVASQGTKRLVSSSRHVHQVAVAGSNFSCQEIAEGTHLNNLQMQGTEDYNLESEISFLRDHYSREHSGLWIFPNEASSGCATTVVKRVVDLMCHIHGSTSADSHDAEKSHQVVKNRKPEETVNSEDHRGPFGQVVKIAIMIGFATLVLLTRQRK